MTERASEVRTTPPEDLDAMFHALADPTRRAIVERVNQGPMSVSDLARPFALTLAAVLHHIKILESSGLIRTSKTGRTRQCEVNYSAIRTVEEWFRAQHRVWEGRLDRLGDIVGELDQDTYDQAEEKP